MKTALGVGRCLVVGMLMLSPVNRGVGAETAATGNSTVTFLQAPEGAKLMNFQLAVPEGPAPRQQGYLVRRSPQPIEATTAVPAAVEQACAGKEFSAFEIAALPDGTRYLAVLTEDKSIKFLNRSESRMWYARVYRVAADADSTPELLCEGFQSQGNDVTVPVEIELPGIGATHVKTLRTEIGYSLNLFQEGKPQVYSGRGAGMQVVGSHVIQEGKLTLTVTVPEEMKVTPDVQVTLGFEPLKPGLPQHSATGKVTDFLTLGAARFVVTGIAPDFSSATVALVAGSLEETLKQQLQLGSRMPPFSQVELLTRKTYTSQEVLEQAKKAGGVVFVFGDLVPTGGGYGPPYGPSYGGQATTALPLPAAEVAEQMGLSQRSKPLVIFVTRQIGIDFLYQDFRNKTPDFLVLADYADPLQTIFRQPARPGTPWYGSPYHTKSEPSLRQLFNLPDRLSVAAFDRKGEVVYVKADAGRGFLPSLAEARTALAR